MYPAGFLVLALAPARVWALQWPAMACWVGNVLLHSRHAKEVRFGLRARAAAGFFLSSSFASGGHTVEHEDEDDPVAPAPVQKRRLAFHSQDGPSMAG